MVKYMVLYTASIDINTEPTFFQRDSESPAAAP